MELETDQNVPYIEQDVFVNINYEVTEAILRAKRVLEKGKIDISYENKRQTIVGTEKVASKSGLQGNYVSFTLAGNIETFDDLPYVSRRY